jgi:hypothetical protein
MCSGGGTRIGTPASTACDRKFNDCPLKKTSDQSFFNMPTGAAAVPLGGGKGGEALDPCMPAGRSGPDRYNKPLILKKVKGSAAMPFLRWKMWMPANRQLPASSRVL